MNPVLIRHLYQYTRKNRFFWLLSLYLLFVALISAIFITLSGATYFFNSQINPSMQDIYMAGRILYWFSSIILIFAAALLAPTNALSLLSSERENRTLDLLRTTSLNASTIVWGKLLSALLSGGVYVLAPLPLLMLGFWVGGVSLAELLLLAGFLIITMIASTSVALYLSAHSRRTITAVLIFYGVNFALLPLVGILSGVMVVLVDLWRNSNVMAQPFWIEAVIQYGWVILAGFHPLTASISSQALWTEQGSWGLLDFSVTRGRLLGTVVLPSPWITYTVLSLLLAILLMRRTIRQLGRPEK